MAAGRRVGTGGLRAVRAAGLLARSSIRYRSVRPRQEALRRRIRDLAGVRVRSGYRQIHVLLRREGWTVSHKRVNRLYTEEGLTLKRRKPKRRTAAANRKAPALPTAPNERWAMDFIHDTLAGGETLRFLSVLELCTRECLLLAADRSFQGEQVARVLGDLGKKRGIPARITVDNGTELTSKVLDHWAYWNRVELDFTRPEKPVDNAHEEAFQGTLRRECLSQHWFLDLEDARRTLETWRADYNNHRPHSTLGQMLPPTTRPGATSPRAESGSEIRVRNGPESGGTPRFWAAVA